MSYSGYGSGSYGEYSGYEAKDKAFPKYPGVYAAPPPAIIDPFSGSYVGNVGKLELDMEVDLDKIRERSPVLNMLSGTLLDKEKSQKLWTGDSTAAYFRTTKGVKVERTGDKRTVKSAVTVTLSNGNKMSGDVAINFHKSRNEWQGRVKFVFGSKRLEFDAKRTSSFFRDVNLDIDYTEEVVWPTFEVESRELNPFLAFEDAGIKLLYDKANGNKIEDPSSYSPWTRNDLYEMMRIHFDEVADADSNIWCMMGTTPPDKKYMGFSFDRNGQHGFALFTGQSSFKGHNSDDPEVRKFAQRSMLHYLVHECGHCLGLAHPFEKNEPDSLSWMNYAWKYDSRHGDGRFYEQFDYRFSNKELEIMRHAPGKNFKKEASRSIVKKTVDTPYGSTSYAPDKNAADDSSDSEGEGDDEGGYGKKPRPYYEKPKRKIELKLKIRERSYTKGKLVDYEVRVKNVGKLAALIDSDLSVAGGNLRLYVSNKAGDVQTVEPFVHPIKSSYTSPRVLYTAEDDEGPDRYSDYGSIGEGKDGAVFDKPGTYTVRAQYSAGRYDVTSDSYTVEIEEPEMGDQEESDTYSQISEMAEIGGSSSERFNKALNFFENLSKEPVEKKKSHVASMIALFEGMSKSTSKHASRKVGKRRKLTEKKAARKPAVLLRDSADVIGSYHTEGKKSDNLPYSKLVMVRAKMYVAENRMEEADREVNQLYGDLLSRGVKYDALQDIRKQYTKIKNPKPEEEKQTPSYYQGKVTKVLDWVPRKHSYGDKDITGLGLGMPFSDFNDEHKQKGDKVYKMLKNKYNETQNVVAVMKYADGLQRGREANDEAVKYAVRGFIVHTRSLKKLGIRYPEPKPRDETYDQLAALMPLERKGASNEDWMNYWRCDSDLNFHHSHWHSVYNGNNWGDHLKRRGELFGYMHSQMLARYDAERESWGLLPVQPLGLHEEIESFNAGTEFHQQNGRVAERIKGKLDRGTANRLLFNEANYKKAIETDRSNHYDANWAGGVLESCISEAQDLGIGSMHNAGHGALSQLVNGQRVVSYMSYTHCAIRDPVFYRWHKRIDNLWQQNNDRLHIKLEDFGAPVTITPEDVVISSSEKPRWGNQEEVIKTHLNKPKLLMEFDDKLDHEPFFFHIRARSDDEVRCTVRIFICPARHADKRRRWIEMDKFVHTVKGETVITRKDRESSVIRRTPEMYSGAQEGNQVAEIPGWCECGLPYSMLLPRGTKPGEKYMMCVIMTNNKEDSVSARTVCGSMSYCGAVRVEYPDARQMGFPFNNNFVDGYGGSLLDALKSQPHIALKTFVIQNTPSWRELEKPEIIDEVPPLPPMDNEPIWPNEAARAFLLTESRYRPSGVQGTFYVRLYNEDFNWDSGKAKPRVVFSGRGYRNGAYEIEEAAISLNEGNKMDPSRKKSICVNGSTSFTVPEGGITSDPIPIELENLGDYWISFRLKNPGCYVKVSPENYRINTSVFRGRWGWKEYKNIYCVQKIIL